MERALQILSPSNLLYFRTLVESGSMTAAASALGVSQPSLSVAIRKMENALDTTLLLRGRSGVSTTDTGRLLYARAGDLLRLLSETQAELADVEGALRGSVSLGCHESLASYTLPVFLKRFTKDFPDIEIRLVNQNSRDVEASIINRDLDMGLVVNPRGHEDCVIRNLFADRVTFVVSKKLSASFRKKATAAFGKVPLFYVSELRQSQYLLAELHKKGVVPSREIACSSLALVKSFVRDGVGIGILPLRVARHGASSSAIPLSRNLPFYDDQICLLRRFDLHMTRAMKTTWEALEKHGLAMPTLG